ncbi:hypothetical protein CXT91_04130 [Akkermansia muciniphila]|nr:hypothetical protein CXT91_04130 [Akkermansia muciniphila]
MISVRFSFPGSHEKKLAALFFPGNSGAAETGSGVARRRSGSERDRLEKQGFGMHSFPQKL